MSTFSFSDGQAASPAQFDLFRLSKAKAIVDLSPNTLRSFHQRGLPFYRSGRIVFVSKADLAIFMRSQRSSLK